MGVAERRPDYKWDSRTAGVEGGSACACRRTASAFALSTRLAYRSHSSVVTWVLKGDSQGISSMGDYQKPYDSELINAIIHEISKCGRVPQLQFVLLAFSHHTQPCTVRPSSRDLPSQLRPEGDAVAATAEVAERPSLSATPAVHEGYSRDTTAAVESPRAASIPAAAGSASTPAAVASTHARAAAAALTLVLIPH